ncbi:MFS transporter [Saccharopolyspora rosea]|uniref:MFS transporter n=1 Tax=Saccharopolyspora rosea TaxID=524884 RepID=A0ABW3G0G4_9PSEU|nr:MFS transporter [Saccharopolyspora rosea]
MGRIKRAVLFATLAVDALGSGLFVPISLLYFTRVPRIELAVVGVLLSTATAATLPLPALVGHLVDRVGAHRVVVSAQLLQAVGFFGYLAVSDEITLVLAAFLVSTGQRAFWSSIFTFVSEIAARDPRRRRDEWFAVVGMAQAGGYGTGGLVAGLLLSAPETTWRTLITISASAFTLAALVLIAGFSDVCGRAAAEPVRGGYRNLVRDRPFLGLVLVNSLFTLSHSFLGVALPIYVARGLPDAPSWLVGPLLAMNTAVLALGQARATKVVRDLPRTRSLALAGAMWSAWGLAMACAVLVPGRAVLGYLVVVTLCFTAAELVHAPTSNALASAVAPDATRGRYLAVFQYSFTISGMVAPALFATLFSTAAPLPWIAIAALAATGAVGMLRLEKHLPQQALGGRVAQPAPD